jgi:hypothetical protein
MTAKIIARKIGLNPSSNGQLMKTALEAGGLAARFFATQLLGLRPQRVANSQGSGGRLTADWGYLDAAINDRPLELRRGTLRSSLFHCFRHDMQYETSGSSAQAHNTGRKSQKRPSDDPRKTLIYQTNPADVDPLSGFAPKRPAGPELILPSGPAIRGAAQLNILRTTLTSDQDMSKEGRL